MNLVKPHEAVASRSEVLSKSVNAENKKETTKRLTSLRVEDLEEHEAEKSDMKKGGVTTALTPPEAMFKPIEYPPLHIFVSASVLIFIHSLFQKASFYSRY